MPIRSKSVRLIITILDHVVLAGVDMPIRHHNRKSVDRSVQFRGISTWLSNQIARYQPSEEFVLIVTSLIVGIGTGVGAVIFRYLIDGVAWISYVWIPSITGAWGRGYVILVPAIGGLCVGLLVYFFAPEAKGHGVPEVMEAVALKGGRIRPVVAVVKSLASSITIGSGGSAGREGPIVQIGSALGSTVGQLFQLSDNRIRNLVACGSAAGIAATFHAPIAGVIFALEVILGEFTLQHFSTIVIAAVSASVIGQAAFGDIPAFPIPPYHIESTWEFALFPFLGLLAAIVGLIFVRLLYGTEDIFDRLKRFPPWIKPAIGGALLGLLGFTYPFIFRIQWEQQPQFFNVGYDVIEGALTGKLLLGVILSLLFLKLLATPLTLGSGGSGGVFAPSLFMGAMLGSAFGIVVNALFPGMTAPPGAYGLVGMGAVFSAVAHAPITAVLIMFELTNDYRIILPLMLTVGISTFIGHKLLQGESIYTVKLSRRGVRLRSGQDTDLMQGVLVEEVMTSQIDAVRRTTTIGELSHIAQATYHHGFPVIDEDDNLWGIVTVTDLEGAFQGNLPRSTMVEEICTPGERLLVCYPDENISAVLSRMGPRGLGRMPVVSRDNQRQMLGLVRRSDIVRAYMLSITRKAEIQYRIKRMSLRDLDGYDFVEFEVEDGDQSAGKSIEEVSGCLPESCVIVSVRKNGRLIIPRGKTILNVGDAVTGFVSIIHIQEFHDCMRKRLQQS